jgi:hypothetical protein
MTIVALLDGEKRSEEKKVKKRGKGDEGGKGA